MDVLQAARFQGQRTECHVLETAFVPTAGVSCIHTASEVDLDTLTSTRGRQHTTYPPPAQSQKLGTLVCLFQNERSTHKSGLNDELPFPNGKAALQLFKSLDLPMSYFRVAHSSVAVAHAAVTLGQRNRPRRFEFITKCISKFADWAFALSHDAASGTTSVFWGVGRAAGPEALLLDLLSKKRLSHHPMLVPCIMFSHMFELAMQRRAETKRKLKRLEHDVSWLSTTGVSKNHPKDGRGDDDFQQITDSEQIESLSETLNACRSEQASREGRYHSWQSYYDCLEKGFGYWQSIISDQDNEFLTDAHTELSSCAALTWAQMQSLKARDVDEVTRVSEISEMVRAPGPARNARR